MDDGLVDETKHEVDGETSSIESTPDRDVADPGLPQDAAAPPQKRKGGRKPIYATSEERKQRNRQAQAAFRERRTEYIKQLEATIKQNEETLSTLQQNHRSAADECLMLRYKNSLLERILLEKGIDVQAELQLKASSPTFSSPMLPGMPGPMTANRAQLQRAAVQRHHARRSATTIASSYQPGAQPAMISPQTAPTPSSHISSPSDPSAGSPSIIQAPSPTSNRPLSQQDPRMPPDRRALPANFQQAQRKAMAFQDQTRQRKPAPVQRPGSAQNMQLYTPPAMQATSAYYPSPFQKHIDQLEHEYDNEAMSQSMLDQLDHEPSKPFPPRFDTTRQAFPFNQNAPIEQQMPNHSPQQLTPHSQDEPMPFNVNSTQAPDALDAVYGNLTHMIDPDDPMLDADPFGLTASMHYTTAYSYEQPPRR